MRNGHFKIKRVKVCAGPFEYWTYRLSGWLDGRRIRRQFQCEAEASGAKNRYEVQAANVRSDVRILSTRLSNEQLADAETALRRLGGSQTLSFAVDWFLANYRPPIAPTAIGEAVRAFIAERGPHVSLYVFRDYKRELKNLQTAFPDREIHSISTAEVQSYMAARGLGRKGWNNLRGELHAFFEWCAAQTRRWCSENPVAPITKHRVARGLPEILTAQQVAELMAYVEDYAGGPRSTLPRGCLAPYFALCVFAGIRPTVPHGEVCKLGRLPAPRLARAIDLGLGVIRIEPEVSKTHDLRQIVVQPNLRAWLERYPLKDFPIVMPNLQKMVTAVRNEFLLGPDVLRHTFISMHVAKFRSMGAAALEAGNSESIIKRHYLNLVGPTQSEEFWCIQPVRTTAERDISPKNSARLQRSTVS